MTSLLAATAGHAQFDTIIDVPPDPALAAIGSNTQLNLFDNGTLPDSFQAGVPAGSSTNAEVNIFGGIVGHDFQANAGSRVNIAGGTVGVFWANGGSDVNITGGSIASFGAQEESRVNISGGTIGPFSGYAGQVTISGGEFRLNGIPIDGLTTAGDTIAFDLPEESLLSGILADGTPFAISSQLFAGLFTVPIDHVSNALTLQLTSLPPIGPAVITASENPIPQGIRDGQTLVVDAGGVVGDYFSAGPGSRVVVQEGGVVGDHLEAIGAAIEVAGGTVGTIDGASDLWAFTGTHLLVSGGDVQKSAVRLLAGSQATLSDGVLGFVEAAGGSILRVEGGEVKHGFLATGTEPSGGIVAISGGRVGFSTIEERGQMIITGGEVESISTADTSQLTIAGGGLRRRLETEGELNVYGYSGFGFGDTFRARAEAGSQVNLMGTEFSVAGVPLSGLSLGEAFTVDDRGGSFTGRLADGSEFYFGSSDVSPDATLTFTLVSLLEGDYNSNGTVEQADLDLVLLHWGEELFNPFSAGWFNDLPDGQIDQSELDAVLLNWGRNVAELGTSSVPEPGTFWIAVLVGILALRFRSRGDRHTKAVSICTGVVLLVAPSCVYAQILNRTMTHDGITRDYTLFIPSNYSSDQEWPLVVNMHGDGFDGPGHMSVTGMNNVAEREGFIVVYPSGVSQSWIRAHDHVGFLDRVVDAIEADYSVDSSRVHAAGLSSGGAMAVVLGLLRPHKYAAAAITPGGGLEFQLEGISTFPPEIPTLPNRPYPFLGMAGTADPISPYEAGMGETGIITAAISKEQFVADWSAANGSQLPLTFERLPDLDPNDGTTVDLYSCLDCDTYVGLSGEEHQAEVLLYRINGGAHNWPDEHDQWPNNSIVRPITGDISASNEVWDFFSRHELPAAPEPSPFSIVASTHSIWDLDEDEIGDRTNTRRRSAIGGTERIITKFDLPDQHGQQLENATLRIYLEDLFGTPPSAISVFHSLTDNDLDQVVSDYHDDGYVDTMLTLSTPDAEIEQFYEVDVTDLVLADYAADGDDPMSAFRLQLTDVGENPLNNYFSIENSSLYARNPTLILTTVMDPEVLAGDYNGNGTVEQADLDLVLLHWGSDASAVPETWTNDLPSGAIDQEELDGVLLNWGTTLAPIGTATIPEPTALILLLIGSASLLAVRRTNP